MATTNRGKQFEERFQNDFERSFPDGTIDRIYDTVNGYKTISNVSDFIGYNMPHIFYLECKSTHENTIVCYLDDTDKVTVYKVADEIIKKLNQNTVLINLELNI